MDHHLVLILKEVLEWITLTAAATKSQNHELLRKFIFQYALGERGIGCIGGDGSESIVMWHPRLFDLLLYKLVEILDTDELIGLPPRMIMSILRAGIRRT